MSADAAKTWGAEVPGALVGGAPGTSGGRPIRGFEGLYEVDEFGTVWSLRRRQKRPLSTELSDNGYMRVRLCIDYRVTKFRVHVLVLEAFVGPRPEGMQCCHNDGNKTNNVLSNLRWGTAQENALDTVAHGSNWNASKTHCKWGHEFTPENTLWSTRPTGRRGRRCRECGRAKSARSNQRRRGVAA